jgi:tRNA-binding EMAP/Myf-like protein
MRLFVNKQTGVCQSCLKKAEGRGQKAEGKLLCVTTKNPGETNRGLREKYE